MTAGVLLLLCAAVAGYANALGKASDQARGQQVRRTPVLLTVVDENGVAVSGAEVDVLEPGSAEIRLWTDFAGHCAYTPQQAGPYRVHVSKAGFYQAVENAIDPQAGRVRVVLAHEQTVIQQVNVTASVPGIDTEQTSDKSTMNTSEIVDIPYPTSRDIRNLLPFNPDIVQDLSGQVHVAGSQTWETLDTLDGFDIRSPVNGTLDARVSADAVRSIDTETTRYPVEYGRTTGGVLAFYTGMGDNKIPFQRNGFCSFRAPT